MINSTTGFINDAIAIDPYSCGCTDCLIGDSIPEHNTDEVQEAYRQMFEEGRQVIYRAGGDVLVYKTNDGRYETVSIPWNTETLIVPDVSVYDYDEFRDIIIHQDMCVCDSCAKGVTYCVNYDNEDTSLSEALVYAYSENIDIINLTGETFIVFIDGDEASITSLPNIDNDVEPLVLKD